LAAGVTFLEQGFSPQLQELTDLIVAAVKHPGFSLVNVFSPCVTFNEVNTYDWFKDKLVNVKDIAGYDANDKGAVLSHVLEHEGLLTGVLYENSKKQSYEEISGLEKNNKMQSVKKLAPDVFDKLLQDFY
jgi:2-oxoglutarate ferredoxin oxidoreductase subunit beta